MKKIFGWICKHRFLSIFVIIAIFIVPLVIVHIMFKLSVNNDWIAAEWEAGDILAYIAGFEALVGTTILSFVAVYQSITAQEENKRISEENNYLQKISIQRLLPILKVTSLKVENSQLSSCSAATLKNALMVSEKVSREGRKEFVNVYLRTSGDETFEKEIKLSLENISDGVIRRISFDKITFSPFRLRGEVVNATACTGVEKYKYVSRILLPREHIEITMKIYFDDIRYKQFWEFQEDTDIGSFGMCVYLTNTSITGIDYAEKIYIEKSLDFEECVMYKAYEEDTPHD